MNSTAELNAIAALNLEQIKVKLMHKESGEGWSRSQVEAVESEYRRFLHLLKLFPNEQLAPRGDVDIFWHYHILDTMKYAVDCETIFGYFLHHCPYSGLEGGANAEADHDRTGARTQALYKATFGEDYMRPAAGAQNDRSYRADPVATSAQSAWCDGRLQQAGAYSVRPVAPASQIAWCDGRVLKNGINSAHPVAASSQIAWCDGRVQKNGAQAAHLVAASSQIAWCDGRVQKNGAQAMHPVAGSSQIAWCDGRAPNDIADSLQQASASKSEGRDEVAQNDESYSAHPVAEAANMAWCDGRAPNDHAAQAHPLLAKAA